MTYKNNDKVLHATSVSCRMVVLHYKNQTPELDGTDVLDASPIEIKSMMNFFYQKSLYGAAGDFSVELPNISIVNQKVAPGDWAGIYIKDGTNPESLRCLGLISRVQKRINVSTDGTKTTTWQVTGKDWSNFLSTYKIWVNPQRIEDQLFRIKSVMDTAYISQPADELVKTYLNRFLVDYAQDAYYGNVIRVPDNFCSMFLPEGSPGSSGGQTLYSIIDTSKITSGLTGNSVVLQINTLVPLWTLLQTVSNPIVNEMYTEMDGELGKEKPSLFLRPYPFSWKAYSGGGVYNNKFLSLPGVHINTSHIVESALGISDAERQNIFKVFSSCVGSPMGASINVDEFMYRPSIVRYGPMFAQFQTTFADHQGEGGVSGEQLITEWKDLLTHWYVIAHLLENGSMTIKGDPNIRIGKRLDVSGYYADKKILKSYYIVGYTDQWNFPGVWTQTLFLNRGIVVKDDQEKLIWDFEDDTLESSSYVRAERGK